jgi:hypothetical protein
MTEEEWLTGNDPEPLLRLLGDKALCRKGRLFALACCRNIEHLIEDEAGHQALKVAERYADGNATNAERRAAHRGTSGFARSVLYSEVAMAVQSVREQIALRVVQPELSSLIEDQTHQEWSGNYELQNPYQANLLRDIFGNPFRPVTFSPEWRTDTAVSLARQMYESREFSAMPILADALQDAGCDNDDVLNHCRDATATHVRGCWVVDLVLGKQ